MRYAGANNRGLPASRVGRFRVAVGRTARVRNRPISSLHRVTRPPYAQVHERGDPAMERRHVQAGRDTLLNLADRASSVDAVAELIWNSLDAEARRVEVTVSTGELGGPDEIVVRD